MSGIVERPQAAGGRERERPTPLLPTGQVDYQELGRQAIVALPYFKDLGLEEHESVLESLGKLESARHNQAKLVTLLIEERALKRTVTTGAVFLKKQAEVQAAIEKQTEELFAAQSGADADALLKNPVFRRQKDKAEKEIAKLLSKLTRLRSEVAEEGIRPAAGEWPALSAESAAAASNLELDHHRQVQRIALIENQVELAQKALVAANGVLDDAVSVAYRSKALQQHPDKRKGGASSEDTFAFQRLRSAYETLHDPALRRRYIEALNHDAFLAERAADAQAESAAEAQRGRKGGKERAPGRPLALTGGLPNRVSCPMVTLISADDGALVLQWACHRATEMDVFGYEVQGCLRGRSWTTLAEAHSQRGTRLSLTSLAPGEWIFRVRAAAQAGYGDFSMNSEGVLLGREGEGDPEARQRRQAEAAQRAIARRLEAQESARDALHTLAHPSASRAPDALTNIARAVGVARRCGLPVQPSDASLLSRLEETMLALRSAAENRELMETHRPKLRQLARGSVSDEDEDASLQLRSFVEGASQELGPGVIDLLHQLLKRCAVEGLGYVGRDARVTRILDVLHSAVQRVDLWAAHKITELSTLTDKLEAAHHSELVAVARREAIANRTAAQRIEARKREEERARALLQQRHQQAVTTAAARMVAPAAAASAAAWPATPPAAIPIPLAAADESFAMPIPLDPSALATECPVCLDAFCSSPDREPVVFSCSHLVCVTCFGELRAASKCPICRQQFDPNKTFGVSSEMRAALIAAKHHEAAPAAASAYVPIGQWQPAVTVLHAGAQPQEAQRQPASSAGPSPSLAELFPFLQ